MKKLVSQGHHVEDNNRDFSRLSRQDGIFPVGMLQIASGKIPKMKNLADRIQSRIDALGLKPAVVARDAGLKVDYVRDILRGKKEAISSDSAAALSRVLQCELAWLLTGEADHIPSEDIAAGLSEDKQSWTKAASTVINFRGTIPGGVPEVDARAGAGNGSVGENEIVALRRGGSYVGHKVISEWAFPAAFLRHELRLQPGGIMVLEVVGDSMSPTLETGDRVIIDTNHSRVTPDGIYVIDEGDGPMVKRLQLVRRSDPPEVRILSDNRNHEAYTLRLEDIRIIGRVSGRVTKM